MRLIISIHAVDCLTRDTIRRCEKAHNWSINGLDSGEIRLVDGGHVTMHLRHPEAVAEAIQDLLGRATTAGG